LEKEILFQADLEEILGKRPFDNRTTYDEFVNGTGDQKPAAEGLLHNGIGEATDIAAPTSPAQTES
jgi:AFG3 family protein